MSTTKEKLWWTQMLPVSCCCPMNNDVGEHPKIQSKPLSNALAAHHQTKSDPNSLVNIDVCWVFLWVPIELRSQLVLVLVSLLESRAHGLPITRWEKSHMSFRVGRAGESDRQTESSCMIDRIQSACSIVEPHSPLIVYDIVAPASLQLTVGPDRSDTQQQTTTKKTSISQYWWWLYVSVACVLPPLAHSP